MSNNSQLVLPQPTTIVKTQIETNERLQLYNNLFGQPTNNHGNHETGLPHSSSLNYSLHTFLHLSDTNWVLAAIDIVEIDTFDEKYGRQLAKRKISQIATEIKKFCENDQSKLKGYKWNGDTFGLLMYCYPNLNKCEKYIIKLITKIKQQTNELVYVGIAKMNEWETYEEWKKRAIKSLKKVKNTATLEKETELKTENHLFFSDIDVEYVNPKLGESTHVKQQQEQKRGVVSQLGTETQFDTKMQEISNNEDYDWNVALMAINDFDSFVFSFNNNEKMIKNEIHKMQQEICRLFEIYESFYHTQDKKYFGYNLSSRGNNSIFGLILYDSKDRNKCYIPAHEILETLKEEISMKCLFTVSIGCSRLIEDDWGFSDDWYERAAHNLKKASKNGMHKICFGNENEKKVVDDDMESKLIELDSFNVEEDEIQTQMCDFCWNFSCLWFLFVVKKYGFAAAVDLKKVNLIVNNGNLANTRNIDMKFDFDPTEAMVLNFTTDITYKQIFVEMMQFIDNNNNHTTGRYLEYPKLYLNNNKPQCNNATKCQQCRDTNSSKNKSHNSISFSICAAKRREIANELFIQGRERQCMTNSLSTTAKQLLVSDTVLMQESNEYKLKSNWFVNVYSFLQWQKEVVNVLLHNLVQGMANDKEKDYNVMNHRQGSVINADSDDSMVYDEAKMIEYVTPEDSGTSEVDTSVEVVKFDLFASLHLYLDQLIEYLVLYYTCFDDQSWISVFYPFVEVAIGTSQCKMLFAKSRRYTAQVSSICGELLPFDEIVSFEQDLHTAERCLQEMKAVSIFKRLLCDVYQTENEIINDNVMKSNKIMNNTNDPFDLSHKIYSSSQSTVNNIKSQLKIHQMTGKAVHDSDGSDMSKMLNQDRKDDWIDEKTVINPLKVDAPSFIRLFVIGRIIETYLSICNHGEKFQKIQALANIFEDSKAQSTVMEIVTRLVQDGIKIYMNKWYNEKEQFNIIEMIFNQIILKRFAKEYHNLITYDGKKQIHKWIFNSSDLMCNIFHYLTFGKHFNGDLLSCSLVNSHWLYHVWNINSIYFVNLTHLIQVTSQCDMQNESNVTRIWQRIVKARSIYVDEELIDVQMVDKMLMFGNVVTMNVSLAEESIPILKALIVGCRTTIKNCEIRILEARSYSISTKKFVQSTHENQLSPLYLPNAKYISIEDSYFYRIWTNKCRKLVFALNNMSQEWLEFVIKHCDCSNVSRLTLCLVRPEDDDIEIDEMILKRFVSKLVGLQHLKLVFYGHFDRSELLLWKLLTPTVDKNKGSVEMILDGDHMLTDDESILLQDAIDKQKLKIDKLKQRYTNGELSGRAINNWNIGRVIGSGRFGDVYHATNVVNGLHAAVKFISTTKDREKRMIQNEIAALNKTSYRHVIQLISYNHMVNLYTTMLVFEYMQNGDLYGYLKHGTRFKLPICRNFFDQIVDGLDYLHNKLHIAHRDLNPKNLLLDDDFNIKIADFGCCKLIDKQNVEIKMRSKRVHSRRVGTPGYTAPEMNLARYGMTDGTNPTAREITACDVFSLGIVLWKMMMGSYSRPFQAFYRSQTVLSVGNYPLYKLIEKQEYDIWWEKFFNDNHYYYDNDLKHLFTRLFDPSPKTRIAVSEIRNHKWFTKNYAKYEHDHFVRQMKKMFIQKTIVKLVESRRTPTNLSPTSCVMGDFSSTAPCVITDPLIAMIGICKNGLKFSPQDFRSASKNYQNVINTFVKIWKYKILYKNSKNALVYTNNMATTMKRNNASYKLYWTQNDIELYLEQMRMHLINNHHDGLVCFINSYGDDDTNNGLFDSMICKVFQHPARRIHEDSIDECAELTQIPKIFFLDVCKHKSDKFITSYTATNVNNNDQQEQKNQPDTTATGDVKLNFEAFVNNFFRMHTNVEGYDVQFVKNICKVFRDVFFVDIRTWVDIHAEICENTKIDALSSGLSNFPQVINSEGAFDRPFSFLQRTQPQFVDELTDSDTCESNIVHLVITNLSKTDNIAVLVEEEKGSDDKTELIKNVLNTEGIHDELLKNNNFVVIEKENNGTTISMNFKTLSNGYFLTVVKLDQNKNEMICDRMKSVDNHLYYADNMISSIDNLNPQQLLYAYQYQYHSS